MLRFTRRCEEAIPEFEIFLAANHNDPNALVQLSTCKYLTGGSDKEAIALAEQAIRLSLRDPGIGWWYTWIGFVHLLQSRIDEAIASLEKARSLDPRAWNTRYFLAAAYGFKGEKGPRRRRDGRSTEADRLGSLFEHRTQQSQR